MSSLNLEVIKPNPFRGRLYYELKKNFRDYCGGQYELDDNLLDNVSYCYNYMDNEWLEAWAMIMQFTFYLDDYYENNAYEPNSRGLEWATEIFHSRHSNGTTRVDYMFNFLVDKYWKYLEGRVYGGLFEWAKDINLCLGLFIHNYNIGKRDFTEKQYRNIRYMDVGGWVALMGCHAYSKVEWYDPVTETPAWRRFSRLCCLQMAFVNDTFSVEKEIEIDCNYVVYKAKKRQISIDEAKSLVENEVRQIDKELDRLIDELKALGRQDVNDYIRYSLIYCKGNHYWSTITKRYN